MAPDHGNSLTMGLLEVQEIKGSQQAVLAGNNGASMIPKRSFEGHAKRTVSDVSAELSRSSMNSDLNLCVLFVQLCLSFFQRSYCFGIKIIKF